MATGVRCCCVVLQPEQRAAARSDLQIRSTKGLTSGLVTSPATTSTPGFADRLEACFEGSRTTARTGVPAAASAATHSAPVPPPAPSTATLDGMVRWRG